MASSRYQRHCLRERQSRCELQLVLFCGLVMIHLMTIRVESNLTSIVDGRLNIALFYTTVDVVDLDLVDLVIDASIARSFGAHERHYLSAELKPLLETLGGVAADHGGSGGERGPESATAMAFTRRMEQVRI